MTLFREAWAARDPQTRQRIILLVLSVLLVVQSVNAWLTSQANQRLGNAVVTNRVTLCEMRNAIAQGPAANVSAVNRLLREFAVIVQKPAPSPQPTPTFSLRKCEKVEP